MWQVNPMEYYLAIRMESCPMWMGLEDSILSKISQAKNVDLMEVESRIVFTRGFKE